MSTRRGRQSTASSTRASAASARSAANGNGSAGVANGKGKGSRASVKSKAASRSAPAAASNGRKGSKSKKKEESEEEEEGSEASEANDGNENGNSSDVAENATDAENGEDDEGEGEGDGDDDDDGEEGDGDAVDEREDGDESSQPLPLITKSSSSIAKSDNKEAKSSFHHSLLSQSSQSSQSQSQSQSQSSSLSLSADDNGETKDSKDNNGDAAASEGKRSKSKLKRGGSRVPSDTPRRTSGRNRKRVTRWVDESSLFFSQVAAVVKKARTSAPTTTGGSTDTSASTTSTATATAPSLARAPSLLRTASRIKAKGATDRDFNNECTACDNGDGHLLVCDSCPNVYHMECLDPPLTRIPTEWWFCPACCEGTELEFLIQDEDYTPKETASTRQAANRSGKKRKKRKNSDDESSEDDITTLTPSPVKRVRTPRKVRDPNAPKPVRRARAAGGARRPRGAGGAAKKKRVAKKKLVIVYQPPKVLTDIKKMTAPLSMIRSKVDAACCTRCSSREVYRAVHLQDEKLLDAVLDDVVNVADPFVRYGPDTHENALLLAMRSGNVPITRALLTQYLISHQNRYGYGYGYNHNKNNASTTGTTDKVNRAVRSSLPTNTIEAVSTGHVTKYTHGHRVAEIEASRGGREGDKAFTGDDGSDHDDEEGFNGLLEYIARHCSPEMFDVFMTAKSNPQNEASIETKQSEVLEWVFESGIYIAAEAGNIKMVNHYMTLLKLRHADYNTGHIDAVSLTDAPMRQFRIAASATKKGSGDKNNQITPAHFAAINPNIKYLKYIIDFAGTNGMQDKKKRKPIHFAAAAESSAPLEWLLKNGASRNEPDDKGFTPLTFAARYGRAHNIPLLVPLVTEAKAHELNTAPVDDGMDGIGGDGAAPEGAPAKKAKKKRGGDDDDGDGDDEDGGDGDDDEGGGRKKKGGKKAKGKADAAAKRKAALRPSPILVPTTALIQVSDDDNKGGDNQGQGNNGEEKKRSVNRSRSKLSTIEVKMVPDPTAAILLAKDKSGSNVIIEAAKNGYADCVTALMRHGANPSHQDKEKWSPLHYAAARGHINVARALLEADYVDKKMASSLVLSLDKRKRTPLLIAAKNGQFEMVRYLIEQGSDPAASDSSDTYAAHYAAAYGWHDILTLLHKCNSSMNVTNMLKTSPLFIAMIKGHLRCAQVVLQGRDVNVNARDSQGKTILHHVMNNKGRSPAACLQQLKFLIKERHADVRQADSVERQTPLHVLASQSPDDIDLDIAKLLVDSGAAVDVADGTGSTPLWYAVQHGNMPLIQFFIDQHASVYVRDTATWCTPLMIALQLVRPPTSDTQRKIDELGDDVKREGKAGVVAPAKSAGKGASAFKLPKPKQKPQKKRRRGSDDDDDDGSGGSDDDDDGDGDDDMENNGDMDGSLTQQSAASSLTDAERQANYAKAEAKREEAFQQKKLDIVKLLLSKGVEADADDITWRVAQAERDIKEAEEAKAKQERDDAQAAAAAEEAAKAAAAANGNGNGDGKADDAKDTMDENDGTASKKGKRGASKKKASANASSKKKGSTKAKSKSKAAGNGENKDGSNDAKDGTAAAAAAPATPAATPLTEEERAAQEEQDKLEREVVAKQEKKWIRYRRHRSVHIDARNKNGDTALSIAMSLVVNIIPLVDAILQYNPSIEMKNKAGYTPLQSAILSTAAAAPQVVQLLIAKNANMGPFIKRVPRVIKPRVPVAGESPSDIEEEPEETKEAEAKRRITEQRSLLMMALVDRSYDLSMIDLLLRHGAAMDGTSLPGRRNILHYVANKIRNDDIVPLLQILHYYGGDELMKTLGSQVDQNGKTPLLLAASLAMPLPGVPSTHGYNGWYQPAPQGEEYAATLLKGGKPNKKKGAAASASSSTDWKSINWGGRGACPHQYVLLRDKWHDTISEWLRITQGNINQSITAKIPKLPRSFLASANAANLTAAHVDFNAGGGAAAAAVNGGASSTKTKKAARKRRSSYGDDDDDENDDMNSDDDDHNSDDDHDDDNDGDDGMDESADKDESVGAGGAAAGGDNNGREYDDDTIAAIRAELKRQNKKIRQDDLGYTLLHMSVYHHQTETLQWLIKNGIDVSRRNHRGETLLMWCCKQSNVTTVPRILLEAKTGKGLIHARDRRDLTALHFAVNYSGRNPSDDQRGFQEAFQMETFLLSYGADINAKDSYGRTPLHYVFVPIGKEYVQPSTAVDPIELLSNVCAVTAEANRVAGATSSGPLLGNVERTASGTVISKSIVLLDEVDVYGRTPIHYAAMSGSQICAKFLHQRGASLTRADSNGNQAFQHALLGGHLGLVVDVVDKKIDLDAPCINYQTRASISTFGAVLERSWQGVAYLMIDAGVRITTAVADALNNSKFQLVLTLINKADPRKVQELGPNDINLFHVLGAYKPRASDARHAYQSNWSIKIATLLLKYHINVNGIERVHNRQAIHLAAENGHTQLVKFLLSHGGTTKEIDRYLHTPLTLAVTNNHADTVHALLDGKADINYRAKSRPGLEGPRHVLLESIRIGDEYLIQMLLNYGADINVLDDKKRTPLMNLVRANNSKFVLQLLKGSAKKKDAGVDLNLQDVDGRTVMHHVIHPLDYPRPSYENVGILNNLLTASIHRLNVRAYDMSIKDKDGRTALYYAYTQRSGVMAAALIGAAACQPDATLKALAIKNTTVGESKDPLDYNNDIDYKKDSDARRRELAIEDEQAEREDVATDPNFEQADVFKVLKDKNGQAYDILMTHVDTQAGPYGANMFYKMQVLHNPITGLYMLWNRWGRVGDTGKYQRTPYQKRDEVVTEFEKIFKSKSGNAWADVDPESFKKVDGKYNPVRVKPPKKKKPLPEFKRVPRVRGIHAIDSDDEYNSSDDDMPTAADYDDVSGIHSLRALLRAPGVAATKLPKSTKTVIKTICDYSSMKQLFDTFGVAEDSFPLGQLNDATLREGLALLHDLQKAYHKNRDIVKKIDALNREHDTYDNAVRGVEANKKAREIRAKNVEDKRARVTEAQRDVENPEFDDALQHATEELEAAEADAALELKDPEIPAFNLQANTDEKNALAIQKRDVSADVTKWSNSFYQLIPQDKFRQSAIRDMTDENEIKSQMNIMTRLGELQIAIKILLGASLRPRVMNPLDYCYNALGIHLRQVSRRSEEFGYLRRYIHSSSPSTVIYNIFALKRKGEDERFAPYATSSNRQLLWHGSGVVNFPGILTQGLRIAPPEADATGYMFGKGIYFADCFQKSLGYARPAEDPYRHQWGYRQRNTQSSDSQTQLLLLCEVACGDMWQLYRNYYESPEQIPSTKGCVKGMGRQIPDPEFNLTMPDGVIIPNGRMIAAKEPIPGHDAGRWATAQRNGHPITDPSVITASYPLNYNEYIIYKPERAKMRYLVQIGPQKTIRRK